MPFAKSFNHCLSKLIKKRYVATLSVKARAPHHKINMMRRLLDFVSNEHSLDFLGIF